MTNLAKSATKLAVTGALLASLAACETNPSKPDETPNLGANTPQGLSVSGKSEADAQKAKSVAPAVLKWTTPKGKCEDLNLTENKVKTDTINICFTQGTSETASATGKPTARTHLKTSTPATKDVVPTANVASGTIDKTKSQTVFSATISFSECGPSVAGVAKTAGSTLGGLGSVFGGIGSTVFGAGKQAINRVAGGGIAGRVATDAATTATNTATQNGKRTVDEKQNAATSATEAACNTQITTFINGPFKTEINTLSNKFAETHAGAKPAYSIFTELPKDYEDKMKVIVGQPVTQQANQRAPR